MTDTSTSTPTADLSAAGVSIWLDDLSRERIESKGLQKLIADRNVVGVTTNPTIFAGALAKGEAYDAQVAELVSYLREQFAGGKPPWQDLAASVARIRAQPREP